MHIFVREKINLVHVQKQPLLIFCCSSQNYSFCLINFLFLCSTFLYETNEYQSLLIPWNKNAKVFLLCFYFKFKWCLLCASIIVILPFYVYLNQIIEICNFFPIALKCQVYIINQYQKFFFCRNQMHEISNMATCIIETYLDFYFVYVSSNVRT